MGQSYDAGTLLARRYRIEEAMGRGGRATAYRVTDLLTERRLVLEVVDAPDDDSRAVFHEAFERLAGLLHPHLVRVRDLGHLDGTSAYFTADDDAATALPDAELPDWASVRPLILDVVDALRCLHGLRLRHGDVTPANIVVGSDGRGTLIDLSCTASFGRPARVAGTPGFIAPELLQRGTADGRADLYGLGATLSWLAEQLELPGDVVELAEQLTHEDPDERPPDVDDVARRLGERTRPTVLASGIPPQLVGRASWLADASERVERALAGEGGPVVITGPPGVGRSRLLEELKWQAQRRVVVVEGAASRQDAVDELIRRALQVDDDRTGIALVVDTLEQWPTDAPVLLVLDDVQRLSAPQREAWWALLRSLPGRVTALTSTTEAPPELAGASVLSVAPLTTEGVARWVGDRLPEARLGDVMRLTDGHPARLAQLLGALRLGELHPGVLRRARPFAAVSLRELATWPEAVVATLALVTARGGRAPRQSLDPSALTEALERGWLVVDGEEVVATRPLSLDAFPAELRRRAHRAAVDLLDPHDPERVVHLLGAGASSEAASLLHAERASIRAAPDAWLPVAAAIGGREDDPRELRAVAAEIYELTGRTHEALSLVARARRRFPTDDRIRLRAGAIRLRRGELTHARRYLEPLAESSPEALDLLSRTVAKQGDYGAARDYAERALALTPDEPLLRGALHDDVGVAAGYLGDSATSREHLKQAAALHQQHGQPHAQARNAIYSALANDRDGNMREAAEGFAEALRIAEDHGAADLVVYAAQQLATATHQLGELERAAGAYERALRLAVALGDRSREADLRANLAKLGADIGLLEQPAQPVEPVDAVEKGEGEPPPERPETDRVVQLERLLTIHRRLTSALEPQAVLDLAIDAALELTGAERGFIMLDRGGELTMQATRNLQTDTPDELAFSQSITQRVIDSGRPVVTIDARADARFDAQPSAHAIEVQSVACMPIIAAAGVLGALYVDHRYVAGVIGPEQEELLGAFADLVAIALHNAFLHSSLAERTRELDALTRGQQEEIDALQDRVRHQQKALELRYDDGQIVGDSPAMRAVLLTLDRVIDSDIPVSIQGESGTGKAWLAKAIHYNGPRRDGPMVTIHCGAVPESRLESELFGHLEGAFTGADHDRPGLFVAAQGGTAFLDEVGEMPAAMQVKLLRVLQEREVTPLGSHEAVPIDVRVITATHRRLQTEVEEGRFREDLYHRLGVVEIEVPPLRERAEDIPTLTEHLLQRAADELDRPRPRLDPRALEALLAHHWPGNVRELENVVTKAVLLADDGVITPEALHLQAPRTTEAPTTRKAFEEEARQTLLDRLQQYEWNISEVARSLGVARTTVYRRMRKYGLEAS